jgi:hypothetical protein
LKTEDNLVSVHYIVIFSKSQQEINVCGTAFRLTVLILASIIFLASLIEKRVDLQKSKMEL